MLNKWRTISIIAIISAISLLSFTVTSSGMFRGTPKSVDFAAVSSAEAIVDVSGSVEIFARIDGIPGESVAPGHINEIDIGSYRFDAMPVTDPISYLPHGEPIYRDFVLVKRLDKSSPYLMVKVGSNEIIPKVDISVRKVGTSVDLLKFTLTNVKVYSFGDNSQGNYPYESVTLRYEVITMQYQALTPLGTPDGLPILKTWSVKQTKELTK